MDIHAILAAACSNANAVIKRSDSGSITFCEEAVLIDHLSGSTLRTPGSTASIYKSRYAVITIDTKIRSEDSLIYDNSLRLLPLG